MKRTIKPQSPDYRLPNAILAIDPLDLCSTVMIRLGFKGYYPLESYPTPALALDRVQRFNTQKQATPEMLDCMTAGSMFGWTVPAARLPEQK